MSGTYQKVIIVGRLGADPELKYTAAGTPVTNMSVATSEKYKDQDGNVQEKTEWHRVAVFGKTAENAAQYLSKGRMALIEGQNETKKWQDQQGNDRYTTQVRAFRVVFMGGGQDQGQQGQQGQSQGQGQQPGPQQQTQQPGPAFPSDAGVMDDAPF